MKTPTLDAMTMAYHELRSPLGLVLTAARVAAEQAAGDDDLRRRCETIVRAAERMLRTAQQVFELSELPGDVVEAPYSPSDVILGVAADLGALGVCVACDVTPGARRAWTTGVAERLEALVQSLLTNAGDHGEPGVPVRMSLDATPVALTVAVTNTIAAARRHKGLGLGSLIANELAIRLGADLEMAAEDGKFTATVRLPLQ